MCGGEGGFEIWTNITGSGLGCYPNLQCFYRTTSKFSTYSCIGIFSIWSYIHQAIKYVSSGMIFAHPLHQNQLQSCSAPWLAYLEAVGDERGGKFHTFPLRPLVWYHKMSLHTWTPCGDQTDINPYPPGIGGELEMFWGRVNWAFVSGQSTVPFAKRSVSSEGARFWSPVFWLERNRFVLLQIVARDLINSIAI